MKSFWCSGLCFALLATGACSLGQPRVSQLATPSDPPPVPRAKPSPPTQVKLATPSVQDSVVWQAPLAAPTDGRTDGRRHVVRRGESLYAVARLYGVPIRAVIDANALRPPYTLAVGQSLTVPSTRTHVVESGDTVYGISRRYGVDMAELVRANDIAAPCRSGENGSFSAAVSVPLITMSPRLTSWRSPWTFTVTPSGTVNEATVMGPPITTSLTGLKSACARSALCAIARASTTSVAASNTMVMKRRRFIVITP